MPKLTVLMSVYNGDKYLSLAIESILQQTFKNFEFLIINDASTDKTREIILSYKDPRIRLLENLKNIGLTASLNKGLKIALGEYIARQDADDISLPKRLEKELRVAESRPEVAVICSDSKHFVTKTNIDLTKKEKDGQKESLRKIYLNDLAEGNLFFHGSVLFKKDLILELGGYDENFKKSQDYELWLRISRKSLILKIEKILYLGRIHFESISWKNILEQEKYAALARRQHFKENSMNRLSLRKHLAYRKKAASRLYDFGKVFFRNKKKNTAFLLWSKSFFLSPLVMIRQLSLSLKNKNFK
ncbi:glycosyltransferase family 2 protein [Candidatus Auribacterota bacterium]